jgi:hypothetical protein
MAKEASMRSKVRLGRLALSVTAGLVVVLFVVGLFSLAKADADVDLGVELSAPAHVAPDTLVEVNVAYGNSGASAAPENTWLTVTLPSGVQFVSAVDREGNPAPPAVTQSNTLAWQVGPLPAGACCRHIFITERIGADLAEGLALTHTTTIATSALESNTSDNTASASSLVCDMAGSAKRVQAREVMPGDVLTYTIELNLAHRQGSSPQPQQRWVTLTDTLPISGRVRFLGWTGALSGTHAGGMLGWQGQVRAGEPLRLQYRLGVEGVVTPGTSITNAAVLHWSTGKLMLGPVTTVVTLPHDAHMFGPQGDTWRHSYGVTLTVPPGAVTDTTRFQFRPLITGTQVITAPLGWRYAHRAFEITAFRFGQGIHGFGQPVTMTVDYGMPDVMGLQSDTLRLWYRQGEGEPWAMLGDPVREMSGTISFVTTHLTQFALFGRPASYAYLPILTRSDSR